MSVAKKFHEYTTKPENVEYSNLPKNKDKILNLLKALTEWLKNAPNRESLPSFYFEDMLTILCRLSHALYQQIKDENKMSSKSIALVDMSTECFRTLRNSCAGCKKNQDEVLKNPGLYWTAASILQTLVHHSPKSSNPEGKTNIVQCLRCGVQFLGNAAAGFEESKSLVWAAVFAAINVHSSTLLRLLMKADDPTLANYTCMLIYTCLTTTNMNDLIKVEEGVEIICAVMNHFSKHETEWGFFILEKLLVHPAFLETTTKMLSNPDKLLLLNFVAAKMKKIEDKEESGQNHGKNRDSQMEIMVALPNIQYLASEFKANAHNVVKLTNSKDLENPEAQQVTRLLEVLCSATSSNFYGDLQKDADLLKCTVNLLGTVHQIGKQGGDNIFSSITKMADANKALLDNPAFGLKRDLIRLIGNLSNKQKANQDKVREMGGLALILDNTNIDARNPFITQWSVFAVRTLCENNSDNQAVLVKLNMQGLADNSTLQREYGLEAVVEGERLSVRPVKPEKGKGPKR